MSSTKTSIALSSYSTAIVFLPSADLQCKLNLVRSSWDKSYPRWTAHFTVLFPFCEPEHLGEAAGLLQAACAQAALSPIETEIDHVDSFSMRTYKTVYLAPSQASAAAMKAAWRVTASTFGYSGRDFVPHLTLGQTAQTEDSVNFLVSRGDALLRTGLRWTTDCFVLLQKDNADGGRMKIAHVVPFQNSASAPSIASELYPAYRLIDSDPQVTTHLLDKPLPLQPESKLCVATYNILEDPSFPSAQRLPQIMSAITESSADVITLQEVSDETLHVLLENTSLRSTYRWVSHGPSSVLPLSRNIVILAKDYANFFWIPVDLGDKHKPAIVASFQRTTGAPLVVAAVHFSAGSSVELVAKRVRELSGLTEYLKSTWADSDWIIVGDTNFQPSDQVALDPVLEDVWNVIGAPEELESTFEPATNVLASLTSRHDNLSKRFDRIYIRSGRFAVDGFVRFGLEFPDSPGSDHWGVAATLSSPIPSTSVQPEESPVVAGLSASTLRLTLEPTSLSDSELLEVAQRNDLLLSNDEVSRRSAAVDSLRQVVCPTSGNTSVCIKLQPVGSFALGVSIPSSDIDCLAVGNISAATFWKRSQEHVRALGWPNNHNIRLRRFVKDAAVQMMELEVGGIKVDLQYSYAPQVVENWENLATTPSTSPIFSLPMASLRTLNAFRDAVTILARVGSTRLPAFRLAHRALRHFCKKRGIFSSKFGYLGSFHLSILIVKLLEDLPQSISAAQIVRSFISQYSHWDWSANSVAVGALREYSRSAREAMVILSPEKPSINVASAASRSTVASIHRALVGADCKLREGASWSEVCGGGLVTFLSSYKTFAKVDISFWGASSMIGRGLVGHLESRFVHLLVQLQSSVPDMHVHLWPERLAEASTGDDEAPNLQAFYLFGLSGPQHSMADTAQTRLAVLEAFAEDIRGHARYYDPTHAFIYGSEVSRESLGTTVVTDTFTWPDGGIDEAEPDDDEVENENRQPEDFGDDSSQADGFALDRSKKDRKQKKKPVHNTVAAAAKLRPSADVYNRLMWDPSVSSEDYVIGYEDRFSGVKEMPLGMWKREVEDEAFVPFHRVVHFRRRSDNVVVWDRAARIDLVFGSGRAQ